MKPQNRTNSAYPLVFRPLVKERVWGGSRLAAMGKPVPKGMVAGESWELADLPESVADGRSVIANGPLEGLTLRKAIAQHREQIMGAARLTPEGGFPLLIKLLDARENLSVQVHPNDAYVTTNPECHLKSEAWVVIAAEPGSIIYSGLKPGVKREDFVRHIETGEVIDDLRAIPAAAGQCHYLPSGTCHALGAGILVAEVQTPSDTTFRVYDWGRTGRALHIAQAMQCIQFGAPAPEPTTGQRPMEVDGVRTLHLVATEFFVLERIDAVRDAEISIVTQNQPEVWMMLNAPSRTREPARIDSPGCAAVPMPMGTTTLIPAAMTDARLFAPGGSWLLRVRLPSPLKGMIA